MHRSEHTIERSSYEAEALDRERAARVEAARLVALRGAGILDTAPEQAFDDLVQLAATICGAKIALISFVDEHRQFFKAKLGVDINETPIDQSICAYTVRGGDVLIVPDTTKDSRFAANSLVTGEQHLRFYAGAPLRDAQGHALGALCVLDTTPRPEGLTQVQIKSLMALARQVMSHLSLIRKTEELAANERKFRAIADAMPQMVWSTLPDGFHDYYNDRWYQFTGVPQGSTDGESWNGMFHPDDQARAWERWNHSLSTGEPYEIEYRLRHRSGQYRWTLGRALPLRNGRGEIERWFGTCTDIHDIKENEEARELLTRELSHRIKNIFAVVMSLIGLSTKNYHSAADYSRALRERVEALSIAHNYVRPHGPASRSERFDAHRVTGLLNLLLEAYKDGGRVTIACDDVVVGERAATALALIIHEQATNAVKYGALSNADGKVAVTGERQGDDYVLTWRERGGPRVEAPERKGFGSVLAQRSAIGQLGGRVDYDWAREGLTVRLIAPATRLAK